MPNKPPSRSNPRRKAYFKPTSQEGQSSARPFDRPKPHGASGGSPSGFKPRSRFDDESRPQRRPDDRFGERTERSAPRPFDRPKPHGSSERAPGGFKPRGRFDDESRPQRRPDDRFGERSAPKFGERAAPRPFDRPKPHGPSDRAPGGFKPRGRFDDESRPQRRPDDRFGERSAPRPFDRPKTSIKSKLHFEEHAPRAPHSSHASDESSFSPRKEPRFKPIERPERAERTESTQGPTKRFDRPARPEQTERADRSERTFHDPHPKTRSTAPVKSSMPSRVVEPSAVGEVKVYGQHASLALFNKRPQDIIRLYCLESTIPRITDLLKHCVDNKKAYHVVTAEEMQRITDSVHHEGICILTKERAALSFEELLAALKSQKGAQTLIYLEGVENPHNIGSLLRICAHFGVKYLLTDASELSTLPPATYRVAKGGAEEVTFVPLKQSLKMLQQLKDNGFSLVASSGYAKNSLYQTKLPEKTVFIFGSETNGIADSFLKLCNDILVVPGSGGVESLNVSITSALFLGEFWRQHGQPQ